MDLLKRTYRGMLDLGSAGWDPYSRLILSSDHSGWVLDWEMREVGQVARRLGIRTVGEQWRKSSSPQALFLASQFFLLKKDWLDLPHRIGFSYFHGLPGSGEPLFDQVHAGLCGHHERISRIQTSHRQMQEVILQSGIEASKVKLIRIGINLDYFPFRNAEDRETARRKFQLPSSAFIVGSFQKDGVGWGDGMQPKMVKGPDVFLAVIGRLKASIPELFVLLSGPARGYIRSGLEKLGVPYRHVYLDSYPEIHRLFAALDVYLVTSRQEGGPKAILESMASGVPIISTAVGQAVDLIEHGQNGWLVPADDVDAMIHWVQVVRSLDGEALYQVLAQGRACAGANTYEAQVPQWAEFMEGFVSWRH